MNPFLIDVGAIVKVVLSEPWIIFILVPLFVSVSSILLKANARHEFNIKSEDLIIGFDLGITGCIALLVSGFVSVKNETSLILEKVQAQQNYLTGIFIVLILFMLILYISSNNFSNKAWIDKSDNVFKPHKGWIFGINLGGFFLLIAAFRLAGEALI